MRLILMAALAAVVVIAPSARASTSLFISAPLYDEAIYGTPEAPLAWETGPYLGLTELAFHSWLEQGKIVTLEIENATPGARVNWYGQIAGFVGDDGRFSLTSPIELTYTDSYGRQYAVLRVGRPWPSGVTMQEPFDLVRLGVSGFRPAAAPEPSAWALLILGFGAVGVAARRRMGRLPSVLLGGTSAP